jgi:hypothetical protein
MRDCTCGCQCGPFADKDQGWILARIVIIIVIVIVIVIARVIVVVIIIATALSTVR